jgi:cytochrome b561
MSTAAVASATAVPVHHYHRKTIRLHWVSAVLVVLLWLSAQFIDYFPKGPSRWNMLGVHMSMGVALLVIMIVRIQWRMRPRATAGAGTEPESSTPARCGHVLMYLVLMLAIALGLANAWVRGEHVFNFFQLPAFDPGNKPLRAAAGRVHELAAYAILALAGLHAAIALFHQYVLRDRLLERMVGTSGRE